MDKRELYMLILKSGKRLVICIKPEDYFNESIGGKKRKIIADVNSKLGGDIVVAVKFYGYADVEIKERKCFKY